MKRDMDLVRQILLQMEAYPTGFTQGLEIEVDGFDDDAVGYHVFIMKEAGLIEAADSTVLSSPSPSAIPIRLTWYGHEFLEDAKDPSVWAQSKQVVDKVGGASLAIWSEVLKKTVMSNIGLSD